MRNEGPLAFQDIRKKTKTLGKEYDSFYQELSDIYITNLEKIFLKHLHPIYPHMNLQVHNLKELEKKKNHLLKNNPVIMMDAYSQLPRDASVYVSRVFQPKAENTIAINGRPGYPPLHKQMKHLAKTLDKKKQYYLVDDDTFTGGTLATVANMLLEEGIKIKKGVVGIFVGGKGILPIPIDYIHTYDADEVVDSSDPRDFLLGTYEAGAAILLENGKRVRVPYFWPFSDPTARASIPDQTAKQFSKEVLSLNYDIYETIQKKLKVKLSLKHLWPSFVKYMQATYGFSQTMSVLEIIQKIDKTL